MAVNKKSIVTAVVTILATAVAGFGCLLLAALYGGGNAVDFEFAGLRGYEAAGLLGFFLGAIIGSSCAVYFMTKYFEKKTPHVTGIVIGSVVGAIVGLLSKDFEKSIYIVTLAPAFGALLGMNLAQRKA